MESTRLKNIIILILALLNVFLLGSLLYRIESSHSSYQRAVEQLVELLEADRVTLDESVIPTKTPPPGRTLSRSTEQEQALVSAFLKGTLTFTDQGGGIYHYHNQVGAALFRSNGTFDIVGTQIDEDVESFCRKFCRENDYKDLTYILDEEGNGTATAVRYYDGYPVFNCTITFTIESDGITRVSGTYRPSAAEETVSQNSPLSAIAALTAFLDMRRESGGVECTITDMYLCYELQTSATSSMTLTPAWCIVTDTSSYYVNCYTSSVTHS